MENVGFLYVLLVFLRVLCVKFMNRDSLYFIIVPKIKEGDFMSKKISVSCPLCGEKLIDVIGCCEGVVMKCSCCGASIKTDVEKSGNMKILLQPAIKKVV